MAADVVKDEIEITELVDFNVTRVDGVGSPANGFPVLMMKGLPRTVAEPAVKADGSHAPFTGSHEHAHPAFSGPDGDGDGDHEHGHDHDGDADHHHSHAAKAEFDREAAKALVKAIVGRKVDESPDIAGGTAVLAQIADLIIAEAQELKAGQAGEIADILELACAAEMIWCWRTGEESVASGSVMPATALMQSAAIAAPPDLLPPGGGSDDDASKSQIAKEEAPVDTVTQGSDDLEKAVADAVTKATAPLEEALKRLGDELAKVKATPVPGGPRMSAAAAARKPADDGEDHAAKALYFDGWAERISDPVESDRYRQLAARERAKITM